MESIVTIPEIWLQSQKYGGNGYSARNTETMVTIPEIWRQWLQSQKYGDNGYNPQKYGDNGYNPASTEATIIIGFNPTNTETAVKIPQEWRRLSNNSHNLINTEATVKITQIWRPKLKSHKYGVESEQIRRHWFKSQKHGGNGYNPIFIQQ